MKQFTPAISRSEEIYNNSALRHLPSYEEADVAYSLRLPNYRSSYIRRFHPYPRYITPPCECYSPDDRDEEVLDLSILDCRVRQLAVERGAPVDDPVAENNAVEDGGDEVAVVDAEPVVACNDNNEEQLDPLFIKLDITDTLNID